MLKGSWLEGTQTLENSLGFFHPIDLAALKLKLVHVSFCAAGLLQTATLHSMCTVSLFCPLFLSHINQNTDRDTQTHTLEHTRTQSNSLSTALAKKNTNDN